MNGDRSIHYYLRKRKDLFGRAAKIVCSRSWVEFGDGSDLTTSPGRVTCPTCLKVLIPIVERKLKTMRENLWKTMGFESESA